MIGIPRIVLFLLVAIITTILIFKNKINPVILFLFYASWFVVYAYAFIYLAELTWKAFVD